MLVRVVTGGAEIVVHTFHTLPADAENGLLSTGVAHGLGVVDPSGGRVEDSKVELAAASDKETDKEGTEMMIPLGSTNGSATLTCNWRPFHCPKRPRLLRYFQSFVQSLITLQYNIYLKIKLCSSDRKYLELVIKMDPVGHLIHHNDENYPDPSGSPIVNMIGLCWKMLDKISFIGKKACIRPFIV